MHWINWVVLVAYLAYVIIDGLRRSKGTKEIEGYFLANRSLPWWAVGLSVMATQISAITLVGTTGQGATDGLKFVQMYFGLPIAMVILGITLVPLLHRAKVYTAYEYLERRFDAKTRSLTAFLFVLSRGMSCGAIIAAPAVVFSAVFGWPISWCVALIGVPTVIYTMIGGVQAVAWADVKQMVLVVGTLIAIIVVLLTQIPVSPDQALRIAGAAGRMQVFDFKFDLANKYTFWSGTIGGTFLMLSYFGTDQSQVQRYLAAKSVPEARNSLLISAYWKIPLQAAILLVGILVFVFYIFQPPPLLWNPADATKARQADTVAYTQIEANYADALAARRNAALEIGAASGNVPIAAFKAANARVDSIRVVALKSASQSATADVNYIIPHFVLSKLPLGLAGLFVAAIIGAAMAASSAELSSLSTATIIDFYRRWYRPEAPDAHYLKVSRIATGFWGIFACIVATFAARLGPLIEVVNRFGSFFYGSILGVFLLAMIPNVRAIGAFVGLIAGMTAVGLTAKFDPSIQFLWHNVIGAVAVVVAGTIVSALFGKPRAATY